ncbi:MAG: pyruvate kinase [Proteobacteria bacterium]|nr:pyruvate kinase [Pseudomonadota bacterium]
MRRLRQTKILATLGPATSTREAIAALFEAGTDVFRLNFSHGTHAEHAGRIAVIRELERASGRPIGILMDVQGPKLRIGRFRDGSVELKAGRRFRLDLAEAAGDETRVSLPHPEVFAAIAKGTDLLLDDGKVRLRVVRKGKGFAETEVVTGGRLSDAKGVNVPRAVLPIASLTAKDRKDLAFALESGADYIGLSFVQRPADVAAARRLIRGRAGIMTKLEKPQALDHLREIVGLSDAVMVARGDLGVELPPEEVPMLQKEMIRVCREAGKPVVVATQMLESMIDSPSPTRAEASDVATAVYDGADAVMLSAETAVGRYARAAVEMMDRIIKSVEHDPHRRRFLEATRLEHEATGADAITAAARQVAETVGAAAIVTYTSSGSTTYRAARERPAAPILALTQHLATARRLAVVWGVHAVPTADIKTFADMVNKACRLAVRDGFAKVGERLVVTAGVPFGTPGTTNVLRLATVDAH